ncbi:MAG: hypothetical protein ACRDYU_05935 [Actinomycetes bacterium]
MTVRRTAGASSSAARSNQPYPPAAPEGGFPIGTIPVGSYACHVQLPSAVPMISRYVTTQNAPT